MVIDQGNGGADGGSAALGRLAKTSPAVVFSLLQQLEALGLNVPAVLQQLGLSSAATPSNLAASPGRILRPHRRRPRQVRRKRDVQRSSAHAVSVAHPDSTINR